MTGLVAIVTVLVLSFYGWTCVNAGRMRGKHKIEAPAVTGHPEFERANRVQMNTLEWIVMFLPGMWLFAAYVNSTAASILGVFWIAGRLLYMRAYMRDPKNRSTGFAIQALATVIALIGGLLGAVISLFSGGGAA